MSEHRKSRRKHSAKHHQQGGFSGLEPMIASICVKIVITALIRMYKQYRLNQVDQIDFRAEFTEYEYRQYQYEIERQHLLGDCESSFTMENYNTIITGINRDLYTPPTPDLFENKLLKILNQIIGIAFGNLEDLAFIPGLLYNIIEVICMKLGNSVQCNMRSLTFVMKVTKIMDVAGNVGLDSLKDYIIDTVKKYLVGKIKVKINQWCSRKSQAPPQQKPYDPHGDLLKRFDEPIPMNHPGSRYYDPNNPYNGVVTEKPMNMWERWKKGGDDMTTSNSKYTLTSFVYVNKSGKRMKVYSKGDNYYIRKKNKENKLRYYKVKNVVSQPKKSTRTK